jgi:hypothetical protein
MHSDILFLAQTEMAKAGTKYSDYVANNIAIGKIVEKITLFS